MLLKVREDPKGEVAHDSWRVSRYFLNLPVDRALEKGRMLQAEPQDVEELRTLQGI